MKETWRFVFMLILLASVITVGTLGYTFIEGWSFFDSFYMAVITLTTIGYGEVYPLSNVGRAFTLAYIFTSLVAAATVINYATQQLIKAEVLLLIGRGSKRRMKKLSHHYIVCGYGKMGSFICDELHRSGVSFAIIESDQERFRDALDKGYLAIQGDATDDDTLIDARIEQAKGLVTAVSSTAENVFITLSARQLNQELYILSRAGDDSAAKKLLHAGASKVVTPYEIGSKVMANAILRPHVAEFIEFASDEQELDFGFESAVIQDGSSLCGTSLKSSNIRSAYNVIVVAIKENDSQTLFNPPPDHLLRRGDRLIMVGKKSQLLELSKIIAGEK